MKQFTLATRIGSCIGLGNKYIHCKYTLIQYSIQLSVKYQCWKSALLVSHKVGSYFDLHNIHVHTQYSFKSTNEYNLICALKLKTAKLHLVLFLLIRWQQDTFGLRREFIYHKGEHFEQDDFENNITIDVSPLLLCVKIQCSRDG